MKKFLKRIMIIFMILFLYAGITMTEIATYRGDAEISKADCVIVLGASSFNGMISMVYEGRIHYGIELYEEGYADKILFTGGFGEGSNCSEANAARRYALDYGLSDDVILLEENSHTTIENIRFSKEIMETEGLKSALLVSDPYHMKRAMLMARDVGISCQACPTPYTRYLTVRTKIPFLFRELLT